MQENRFPSRCYCPTYHRVIEEVIQCRSKEPPLCRLIFLLSANARLLHPVIADFCRIYLAASRLLMCKPTSCVYAVRNERQIDMVSTHRVPSFYCKVSFLCAVSQVTASSVVAGSVHQWKNCRTRSSGVRPMGAVISFMRSSNSGSI